MKGDFYEDKIKQGVLEELDAKYKQKIDGLYEVIKDLKSKYIPGALIVTGLVASLVGGSVGYVLHNRLNKEIRDLDTKVSLVYLQSTMPDNPILPDDMTKSMTSDSSIVPNSDKSVSDEVMDFNGKMLIQPVSVPGSSKQLESSFEGY